MFLIKSRKHSVENDNHQFYFRRILYVYRKIHWSIVCSSIQLTIYSCVLMKNCIVNFWYVCNTHSYAARYTVKLCRKRGVCSLQGILIEKLYVFTRKFYDLTLSEFFFACYLVT